VVLANSLATELLRHINNKKVKNLLLGECSGLWGLFGGGAP
jgi:hypothetical protein